MKAAFEGDEVSVSMFENEKIRALADESVPYARDAVSDAVLSAVPVFCLSSAIAWYDGLFAKQLPTAMVQAQRDYFGAHTYHRMDRAGTFHTEWDK
jgi:6-phosphogluconate dehydrogenase